MNRKINEIFVVNTVDFKSTFSFDSIEMGSVQVPMLLEIY